MTDPTLATNERLLRSVAASAPSGLDKGQWSMSALSGTVWLVTTKPLARGCWMSADFSIQRRDEITLVWLIHRPALL